MPITGIKGIHHLAISVPDIEKAQSFYCDVLGLDLVTHWDFEASADGDAVLGLKDAAAKTIMVAAGNIYLEIFEFTSPAAKPQLNPRPVCDHGYTHLAFEVEDIHAAYTELEREGVQWHTAPSQAGEGYMATYGRDPFGNVIEIQQLDPMHDLHMKQLPNLPF